MAIEEQTQDIAQAVHENKSDEEIGAGDQVCCVSIFCHELETISYMLQLNLSLVLNANF